VRYKGLYIEHDLAQTRGGRGGATSVSEDLSSQGGGRNTESGNRLLAKMATIHVPIFVAEDRDM
jgi:hypothetical protein